MVGRPLKEFFQKDEPASDLREDCLRVEGLSLQGDRGVGRHSLRDVSFRANGGNVGLLDELAAPDYDEHSPFPGQPNGIEGLKARVGANAAPYPSIGGRPPLPSAAGHRRRGRRHGGDGGVG